MTIKTKDISVTTNTREWGIFQYIESFFNDQLASKRLEVHLPFLILDILIWDNWKAIEEL